MTIAIRTNKYRLLPTRSQHQKLTVLLEEQRVLYNAALEERISAYKKTKKSISLYDQYKSLAECRNDPILRMSQTPSNLQRATLKRLDGAFQIFFRRIKRKGEKAGFPRFRSKSRWNSFGFTEFVGITLKENRIRFKRFSLRVHMHRPLSEGKILSCQFRRDIKGWYVCLQVRVSIREHDKTGKQIGIDMGLNSFVTTSEDEIVPNPRISRRAEKQMRVRQRALTRCKKGSRSRNKVRLKLARLHRKIANTRNTFLHQTSASLIKRFDLIALEDLNIKGLLKSNLARSISDASWSRFITYLEYKAESAGTRVIRVDPRYTSQDCSACGHREKKSLSERVHNCLSCGLVLDRDHNAAKNILAKAVLGLRTGLSKLRSGGVPSENIT